MPNANGTCEYVLDPADPETWGGEGGDTCFVNDELNENDKWSCDRDSVDNSNKCIFHLNNNRKNNSDLNDELISEINEHESVEIIGGQFGDIEIGQNDIYSEISKLNLKHSIFSGTLEVKKDNLGEYVRCFLCQGCTFNEEVYFKKIVMPAVVRFTQSEFNGYTDFRWSFFNGEARFSNTTFRDEVIFHTSKFLQSKEPLSNLKQDLGLMELSEVASFHNSKFESNTIFKNSRFEVPASFSDINSRLGIDFSDSKFHSEKVFTKSNLTDSDFSNTNITNADFESALLSRANLFGSDLRGAKLSGTVLGDVRVNEETKLLGHPSFENKSSHTLSAIQSRPTCVYDPDYEKNNEHTNESKAKSVYQALEELGGKHALPRLQARSFVRRQDLQKKSYWDDATADNISLEIRIIAGGRWCRAKVARATLLYGESPWRVIAGSIGFIAFVSLLYPLGEWLRPLGEDPITYSRILDGEWSLLLESLYFSTLTFTTLGMGDYEPMGLGQILATLNTTFGAVLIALLVFVLGRRAAR